MFVIFPTSECIDTLISFLETHSESVFYCILPHCTLVEYHPSSSQAMTDQLLTILFCSRVDVHFQKRHYQRVAVDSLRRDGADTSIVRVHTKAF